MRSLVLRSIKRFFSALYDFIAPPSHSLYWGPAPRPRDRANQGPHELEGALLTKALGDLAESRKTLHAKARTDSSSCSSCIGCGDRVEPGLKLCMACCEMNRPQIDITRVTLAGNDLGADIAKNLSAALKRETEAGRPILPPGGFGMRAKMEPMKLDGPGVASETIVNPPGPPTFAILTFQRYHGQHVRQTVAIPVSRYCRMVPTIRNGDIDSVDLVACDEHGNLLDKA